MSYLDTLATAQARLAALEAAELKMLEGATVSQVTYDGGSISYAKGASFDQIRGALRECRLIVQRLSGGCRTGGAIIPIMRG